MWHESRSQAEVIENVVRQGVRADELGYDSYWVGEHHFSRHGIVPNTLQMAAVVGARTERIRVGTAVIVLPINHAVRVAEEGAIADIVSGGRLSIGVGAGYQRPEFAGLGVDIDESRIRFSETLDVLIEAWTKDTFSYEGKLLHYDELQVNPKPIQQPHPPIYVAATASPGTIDMAASRGLPLMVGGPTDIMGLAPQVIARWREGMVENGHDPSGIEIPVAKGSYVAPTDEEAEADMAAADAEWDLRILAQIGSPISPAGDIPPGYESWVDRQKHRSGHSGFTHDQDWRTKKIKENAGTARLIGSPETVARRIAELRDMGVTSIFGPVGLPAMPQEKLDRSLELFARTKFCHSFGISGDRNRHDYITTPGRSFKKGSSVPDSQVRNIESFRDQFDPTAIGPENVWDVMDFMANRCPVAHGSDVMGDYFVVGERAEVMKVLQDWRTFNNSMHARIGGSSYPVEMPPFDSNPPLQRHLREILNPYLAPQKVGDYEQGKA